MKHFEDELERILADDPLGLLDVKPKASNAITADQRLIASFEEINAFYRVNSREPAEGRDISERRLFSRLKGLRESPPRAAALKEFDEFNLLGDVKIADPAAIETIDDIMNEADFFRIVCIKHLGRHKQCLGPARTNGLHDERRYRGGCKT